MANDATNEDAEALSRQAGESSKAGNFEDAVLLYERALTAGSARVNDWINKGLALWRLHRNQAAMEAYDRAIALDPNAALAWMKSRQRDARSEISSGRGVGLLRSRSRNRSTAGRRLVQQGRRTGVDGRLLRGDRLF